MSKTSALLTILFVFVIVIYKVDSLRKNRNFQAHYKRVTSFMCRHPRPRAISVTDLITTGLEGKLFFPRMTVLHRCDSGSGCCLGGDQFVCAPLTTTNVEVVFHVTHVLDSDTHEAGSVSYERFLLLNHTRCACKDTNGLPPR